jgi:hypothetical protein
VKVQWFLSARSPTKPILQSRSLRTSGRARRVCGVGTVARVPFSQSRLSRIRLRHARRERRTGLGTSCRRRLSAS